MLKNFNKNLINKNDKLVLAISGGIDSMVLFNYLIKLKPDLNLDLTVVHVDHQKRIDSSEDAKFVKNQAKLHNIPCYIFELESKEQVNFHNYAHKKRYEYFLEIANKVNAEKIVLAHNLNDLAETILMRLNRGSSFEGYRGILEKVKYKNKTIIRPLLATAKADIIAYQKKYNIAYREDSSNKENAYTRNRFRHDIFPKLKQENPQYLEKFQQFSNYQTMAYELIDDLTNNFIKSLKLDKNEITINKKKFLKQKKIIQFESIKKIINFLTDNKIELSFTNLNDIIDLIKNDKPNIQLKIEQFLYIYKSYDKISFKREENKVETFNLVVDDFNKYYINDKYEIIITKNIIKNYDYMYKLCYNNLDSVFPFTIRNRRPGDRLDINIGTKKLKDFFIDKKLEINKRNSLPIMVNKDNEIFYIPGFFKLKSFGDKQLYIYVNNI
ncbi:MAG: tRNA lysidine(34) synthetase TilS [Bacillota bacterium]